MASTVAVPVFLHSSTLWEMGDGRVIFEKKTLKNVQSRENNDFKRSIVMETHKLYICNKMVKQLVGLSVFSLFLSYGYLLF